jgi:hypothetical protein
MKYLLLVTLLLSSLFICGCTAPGADDEKGNWIILPAMEDSNGKIGITNISDTPKGDYNRLVISAVPESYVGLSGESVVTSIIFEKKGNYPLEIENYPPEFLIKNPGDISRPFRIIKRYTRGNADVTIPAGEKLSYEIKWNLTDDNGKNVTPGLYTLEITDVSVWDGKSEEIYMGESGKEIAQIMIKPEGELLQKTIPVNLSKENEEIKIVFDRIEAGDNGTQLFFSAEIPKNDYVTVMDNGEKWSYHFSSEDMPRGYYSIDNREKKYIWNMEYTGGNNNIYSYKCLIEPLTVETGNISIEITNFGPVGGIWNYEIKL